MLHCHLLQHFAGRHHRYMSNYINTGNARILDSERYVAALRKVAAAHWLMCCVCMLPTHCRVRRVRLAVNQQWQHEAARLQGGLAWHLPALSADRLAADVRARAYCRAGAPCCWPANRHPTGSLHIPRQPVRAQAVRLRAGLHLQRTHQVRAAAGSCAAACTKCTHGARCARCCCCCRTACDAATWHCAMRSAHCHAHTREAKEEDASVARVLMSPTGLILCSDQK